jgi:hypothetical protein
MQQRQRPQVHQVQAICVFLMDPFSTDNPEVIIFLNYRSTTNNTSITMKFAAAFLVFAAASQASAFAPSVQQRPTFALNGVLSKTTGRSALDPAVIARYDALPFPSDTILAEYVWVDADGNTRSKTRTLPAAKAESVESLPKWNFDGSSTGQAPGDDSEVILRPCRIFKDPFRPRSDDLDNILVMCDTWTPSGEPLPTNSRAIGMSLPSSSTTSVGEICRPTLRRRHKLLELRICCRFYAMLELQYLTISLTSADFDRYVSSFKYISACQITSRAPPNVFSRKGLCRKRRRRNLVWFGTRIHTFQS